MSLFRDDARPVSSSLHKMVFLHFLIILFEISCWMQLLQHNFDSLKVKWWEKRKSVSNWLDRNLIKFVKGVIYYLLATYNRHKASQ